VHELSIAGAILDLARRHVPPGATMLKVTVEAGPMRAIDPDAMRAAWGAVLAGHGAGDIGGDVGINVGINVGIDLISLPWNLECPACGARWTGDDVNAPCACGALATPIGGDELRLVSVTVDD